MVKQVEGWMTNDGKLFDSLEQAQMYEAKTDIVKALKATVDQHDYNISMHNIEDFASLLVETDVYENKLKSILNSYLA